MRPTKIAPAIAVAALLVLSTLGSRAGTIDTSFMKITGVEAAGKTTSKAQFEFHLNRLEGGSMYNKEFHALPAIAPADTRAALYLDRGPLQNTTSLVQVMGGAIFEGCITVKTSKGTDTGCEVLKSSTINLDPLGNGGTINFSVKSKLWAPRQLLVNLVVTGNQDLGPDADNHLTQKVTPAPPASGPYLIEIDAAQLLARTLSITGSVVSEHLSRTYGNGGGAVTGTPSLARFYTGMAGRMHWDTTKFLCRDELPVPGHCLP